jgi:serine/threonine-protein kinase
VAPDEDGGYNRFTVRCQSCGDDVAESSRFCSACGARLDPSDRPTLTAIEPNLQPSSEAIDGAQFIPGTMLAGRYRIVGLLGRGGMGEVYRAEDLKLGQSVALKFLPEEFVGDIGRLSRFHQEVKLARQISHPNVCRVYDIGESGNRQFLSMEFVDGENLASLLRRIGRLPSDKALQLARQLCAGLAAAHGRGVLHRDLKPANVLIDGQGHARLADFGLAELADPKRDTAEIAGTPGYMAPEQLEGRAATTGTDVYALGLVLYEMFTGKQALVASGSSFGARALRHTTPESPSTHIPDLDPSIERVILRCLEHDPARRPASVNAVAAALPGGNVLAAAVAAGETPSPDMVAAAGEPGVLSPTLGGLCLAGVFIGLLLLVPLTHDINLIGLTKVGHGPQFFVERAHRVLANLGYLDSSIDEAFGFSTDIDYLRHIDETDRSPARWRGLAAAQPASLLFWYRSSARPLIPIGGTNIVTRVNPSETRSGMRSLTLDRDGRLLSLLAVPKQPDPSSPSANLPAAIGAEDWTPLFVEAGLSINQFTPITSRTVPPIFADTRAAWTGVYPERPDVPIQIEAAAAMGKPVFFEIVAPWTQARNVDPEPGNTSGERVGLRMRTVVAPITVLIALLLAFRNLRLGRGDRRGAVRLSLFILAAGLISNLLATGNLQMLATRTPTLIPFVAVLTWLLYIALEPSLRRAWPETMIGWSRLLAGGVRDPLVGRDILVGVLVGIADVLVFGLHSAMRRWLNHPPQFPVGASSSPFDGVLASSDLLLGGSDALSRIVGSVMSIPAWSGTMATFFSLFVLLVLLRRRWLAMTALVLGLTGIYIISHGGWLLANAPADHFAPSAADVAVFAAVHAGIVFVAVRFGLLTLLIASFVSLLLTLLPIAIDPSVPYAQSSWFVVATVIGLATYGWHTALASRSALEVFFRRPWVPRKSP